MSILQDIQQRQFSDKPEAERLLLEFVRAAFPLDVTAVELRPLAVSLNSFNGFATLASGERLFFKTHTEPDNVIGEYYNAALLAQVGYPVIQPLYSSTEAGKQFLIYQVVESPSVFDLAWAIETGANTTDAAALERAQNEADDHLLKLYLSTLEWQPMGTAAKAPIHQLFFHRVMGGRLDRFYGNGTQIALPGGSVPMAEVRRARWVINGRPYWNKLDGIIDVARKLLHPMQDGPSVVGHGDAHNGNVFFRADGLVYFDPAFAGRHDPLLDLVKPLFHNVFAMWMYFPQVKRAQVSVTLKRHNGTFHVEHDDVLHPIREMFLRSKVERVLIPVMRELKARGWLRQDWYPYLKAALFCCPFLTMNLADSEKFPPEISLLGLATAVQMGTMPYTQEHNGAVTFGESNLIDAVLLHNVAAVLA